MTIRTAMTGALWIASLAISIGCSPLNRRNDPLESTNYALPGESRDSDGMLASGASNVFQSAQSAMGWGPNEEEAQQFMRSAMEQYQTANAAEGASRKREFLKAAGTFAKAASRWPASSIEEDALFYEAECYFFADQYPKAEEKLALLVRDYPSSKHLDQISKRRFQVAKYWLDHYQHDKNLSITPNLTSKSRPVFDKFGHAVRILENIRLDDPTGQIADDATMLAAAACFEDGRFYRADEFLNDLRRSFPGSKHQFEAHLLSLKCKIKLYQGPSYDASPLEEAEMLVKQMRRQFPDESGEHHEFLAQAWKDVRMNRAIREMNRARYCDRRQEYRAARLYYSTVAREYDDTSLANEAGERLAQLDGLPDLPPQRMEWLARIFPGNTDSKPVLATRPTGSDTR